MRSVSRLAGKAAVLAILLASGFAPAARAAAPKTSAVTVDRLGFADFGVSDTTIQARLPAGFTVRPCFSGQAGSADVLAFVTTERYTGLRGVDPATKVNSFFVMTCATPPAQFARPDAIEPPYFLLGAWTDSAAFRRAIDPQGQAIRPATFDITATGDQGPAAQPYGFAFQVRDASGASLASGAVATPAAPTPLAPCVPAPTSGRTLNLEDGFVNAIDFDKTESTCLGSAAMTWSATSPLAALVGSASQPLVAGISFVASQHDTYRTLGRLR